MADARAEWYRETFPILDGLPDNSARIVGRMLDGIQVDADAGKWEAVAEAMSRDLEPAEEEARAEAEQEKCRKALAIGRDREAFEIACALCREAEALQVATLDAAGEPPRREWLAGSQAAGWPCSRAREAW